MVKITALRTPEQMRADKLAQMSAEQVFCGAYGHAWPSEQKGGLRPGKAPRGLTAVPYREGGYQVKEHCANRCGRIRLWDTRPDGRFDLEVHYTYQQDKSRPWVTIHDDDGITITRRDKKAELWNSSGVVSAFTAAANDEPGGERGAG